MKKVFVVILFNLLLVGCNEIRHQDLFERTDYFVESLKTQYEIMDYQAERGTLNIPKKENMPIGRPINVRIEQYTSSKDYEE